MKKKIIMLCIVSIYAIVSVAQSRINRGQEAFDSGNYNNAVEQWEAAAIVDKSVSRKVQSLIKTAKQCINLKTSAYTYLQSGEYGKAEATYLELKKLNQKDPSIQQGLRMCQQGKDVLAKESEAGQYWISIKDSQDRQKYERYLSMYPKNKNMKDAKNMLQKLDDTDLWRKALKKNTLSSYNNYLADTKLGIYKQEAQAGIKGVEDDQAWSKAQEDNTKSGYENYMLRYSRHKDAAQNKITEFEMIACIDQAEVHMKAGKYRWAHDELKKATAMGILQSTTLQRYQSIDEEVLYHLCIENTSYHYTGKENCETYLTLYGMDKPGRADEVRKRLGKHTKLMDKDYDKVFNIGLSIFDVYYGNGGVLSGGPKVALRIGSWDFPISFTASIAAYYNLGDKIGEGNTYKFSCWQSPIQGRVKINLFGNGNYKCYIAGGASYNINYAVKNEEKNSTEKLSSDIIHTTNSSTFGEIGVCGKHYEVAFFYSKDLQPFFNKEYFINQYGENSMLKQNQRYGISWACYF